MLPPQGADTEKNTSLSGALTIMEFLLRPLAGSDNLLNAADEYLSGSSGLYTFFRADKDRSSHSFLKLL